MTERRRVGIRALLLAMLLPAMTALLAFDSWRDHRAISRAVIDAYDQVLIEPVQALNDGVQLDANGKLQVAGAFSVQSMFESTRPRHKHLRVGVTPLSPAGPEETLLGSPDLPAPPPGPDGTPLFYDATYRGYPVRIAALSRTVQGPQARSYRVLIQAAESTGAREQVRTDAWHQALRNGVAMVVLMVVLVSLGVALSLRPLERLRRSLAARSPGDLEPLDARDVPREVAPLVETVNHHMASQSRMLDEQRRFLADASHQLRTPLAIMLTQTGYALREREAEPMRETLRAIAAQLTRARRLSEQLLSLAQASDASHDAGAQPAIADLNAVARDVVLQYLPLAREKRQDLGWVDARGEDDEASASDAPAAPVAAQAAELHETLSNLVHNAIEYTPVGGRITVSVRRGATWAEAEVCDTGPGIAPERRAAVFERFQRGEPTRDTSRGAGLGLAIARAYARRNGGEITLDDAPASDGLGRGLRAVLRLPLLGSNPISDNTYFGGATSH